MSAESRSPAGGGAVSAAWLDQRVEITYRIQAAVDDAALTRLHERAFGGRTGDVVPWRLRLERHSLSWLTAHDGAELVGFVNVVGDGGQHAFLVDTIVEPSRQGRGIGRRLVAEAAAEAARLGCAWLHVDYEPELAAFYEQACGFGPTAAGLLRLRRDPDA